MTTPPSDAEAPPSGSSSSRLSVLVVEDEDGVRFLVRLFLERAGYHVYEAAGIVEAERLFLEHGDRIRVLVTDLSMPDGTGIDLAKRLHARRPELGVLFMSGSAGEEEWLPEVGPPYLLPKPFNGDTLVRMVGELVSRE